MIVRLIANHLKFYIKNMVNGRCKTAVKEELRKLRLHFVFAGSGVVDVMENITDKQHEQLGAALFKSGMELMDKEDVVLIEKIKNLIIEKVRGMDDLSPTNFPEYISEKLNYDYNYLAALFSEGNGITIENFISSQKIERVKELVIYDQLDLKEIALKMQYGTVAQLSRQFKKIAGLTLSHFKKLNRKRQILVEYARDY